MEIHTIINAVCDLSSRSDNVWSYQCFFLKEIQFFNIVFCSVHQQLMPTKKFGMKKIPLILEYQFYSMYENVFRYPNESEFIAIDLTISRKNQKWIRLLWCVFLFVVNYHQKWQNKYQIDLFSIRNPKQTCEQVQKDAEENREIHFDVTLGID